MTYIQLAQHLGITVLPEDAAKLMAFVQQAYDAGVAEEQKRCCSLIFGHCSSDNVAQRTVDAIKRGDK